MFFENDFSLSDGTGLVGTQHVHRPKILNGIQPFDDDFFLRHGDSPLGKVDRNDHGQHLGGQPYCHCHGKEKSLQPIVLADAIDYKHQWNHHQHETDHQPGEAVDALIEAGLLTLGRGQPACQ